ncbi:hypothetical protein ZIOFF_014052 [Zingiber officinale]|uniref:Uncharacterized protein n=1 Tax=Zingiber officinale TaxID=94328 RepID=A0A8J5LV45_ZINOF|nr:hypothetical protein ZIOFF_014052 [Zingiber officinale]
MEGVESHRSRERTSVAGTARDGSAKGTPSHIRRMFLVAGRPLRGLYAHRDGRGQTAVVVARGRQCGGKKINTAWARIDCVAKSSTASARGRDAMPYITQATRSSDLPIIKVHSVVSSANAETEIFWLLLDLPGIIEGAKDGKGRGRQKIDSKEEFTLSHGYVILKIVISLTPSSMCYTKSINSETNTCQVISTARTCNCILIVLDAIKPITHKRLIEKELEGFGIRLNKEPPNLTFRKKDKGGINFTSTVTNTQLDLETVKAICSEYKIHNADISLRYDATADDLIDVIEGSRVYIPCIYAVNKIDQITVEELEILDKLPHYCPVSAHLEWNLDGLLEKIWEYLDLVRIYTKPKGLNPDYEDPVILSSKRRTIEDFCNRIHKDMLKQFKYALVWGSSAKHKPQRVGKVMIYFIEMWFRSSRNCRRVKEVDSLLNEKR